MRPGSSRRCPRGPPESPTVPLASAPTAVTRVRPLRARPRADEKPLLRDRSQDLGRPRRGHLSTAQVPARAFGRRPEVVRRHWFVRTNGGQVPNGAAATTAVGTHLHLTGTRRSLAPAVPTAPPTLAREVDGPAGVRKNPSLATHRIASGQRPQPARGQRDRAAGSAEAIEPR